MWVSAKHSLTLLFGFLLLQVARKQQLDRATRWSLSICQRLSGAFKLMPSSTYFFTSLHTLAFLLCTSAVFLGLGLEMWLTFEVAVVADAFISSQGHTGNSSSIFGNVHLQVEFGSTVCISMSEHIKFEVEHSAVIGSSYAPGPFYQVSKFYSFHPLVWTPLAVARAHK